MNKLLNLLKKLIRRIKNNMTTIFISIAGFCFPSAIGLFIFDMESNSPNKFSQNGIFVIVCILFIMTFVSWGAALRSERIERNKERLERETSDLKFFSQIKSMEMLRQDTASSINTLSISINELVTEIRKDRDERNKPESKPK